MKLRQYREALMAKGLEWVRRARGLQRWITIICVAGGGLIATISGGVDGPMQPVSGDGLLTAKGAGVVAGGILIFFGTVVLLILQDEAPALLERASALASEAQDVLDQQATLTATIEAAERLDVRRRHLLQAVQVMQEAVERVPLGNDIGSVLAAMLDAGTNDLCGAVGFTPGERWTFSIFRREPERPRSRTEVMRRIAGAGSDRYRERGPARDWKKKEGFTGVSWQGDEDVIERDLRLVSDQYPIPENKWKPGDAERYVSVAVIPIRVGSGDEMWGSVTATSDCAGRWRRVASDPREQNVMAVRVLAQLIATQVALRNRPAS